MSLVLSSTANSCPAPVDGVLVCAICGHAAAKSSGLRLHQEQLHPKQFACAEVSCGKTFSSHYALRNHCRAKGHKIAYRYANDSEVQEALAAVPVLDALD